MELKAHLYQEYNKLIEQFTTTKNRLDKIVDLLKEYGDEVPGTSEIPGADIHEIQTKLLENIYPKNGTWKDKILFALKSIGIPSTADEIYQFAVKHEHSINPRVRAREAIGAICSKLAKDGEIEADKTSFASKYSLKK